jgi:hypothetical protein
LAWVVGSGGDEVGGDIRYQISDIRKWFGGEAEIGIGAPVEILLGKSALRMTGL